MQESTAQRPPPGLGRHVLTFLMLAICATSLYLCYRAIKVVERAVTVMENIDARLDRAIAAAPAAADRANAAMGVTEEELKDAARKKARDLSDRAKSWLGAGEGTP